MSIMSQAVLYIMRTWSIGIPELAWMAGSLFILQEVEQGRFWSASTNIKVTPLVSSPSVTL